MVGLVTKWAFGL